MKKGAIIKDSRGYPRVYGKPVHKTEYTCFSCGVNRFGFGWCNSCDSWVDALSTKEIIQNDEKVDITILALWVGIINLFIGILLRFDRDQNLVLFCCGIIFVLVYGLVTRNE